MNKVNKVAVKRDIKFLTEYLIILKQHLINLEKFNKKKSYSYFGYALRNSNNKETIKKDIEFCTEKISSLTKRLTCEHKSTTRVEDFSPHKNEMWYDIMCDNCDFILDRE